MTDFLTSHKAEKVLEDLQEDLELHQEDIIAADLSRNGWLTVSRLRNKSSLPSSLLKQIEKEDDAIDRWKRKSSIGRNGGNSSRFRTMDQGTFTNFVRTNRGAKGFQKKSPEELMQEAVRQNRAGQCSHCSQEGHFYRECPSFWQKVHDSRKAQKN